jgi:prepilin-type N-terminal cleavage/methylation domain-containing protein
MIRRGFTIIELIITITIMGILLTLAVVSVSATQMKARDDQRVSSAQAIGSYLDIFYVSGASNAPSITNLSTNPKNANGLWSNTNGAVWTTSAATITGHPSSITTAVRSQIQSGQTNASVLSVYNIDGMGNSTATRSVGAWAFVDAVGYEAYFTGTDPAQTTHLPLTQNTWTYVKSTAALSGYLNFYISKASGNASSADTAYATGSITVGGTQAYDYNDGSSPEWSWSGAANASTSNGPAITGSPGVYPSTSVTFPSLRSTYLPDANTSAFIAPGKSSTDTTFIPATNSAQTATGVLPQPNFDQYIYQPITTSGNLCYGNDCRKFNLYYRLESDNTVYKMTSKNQ